MSQPAEIKRVQILDRIVTVLDAIREGASYFATRASVEKRMTHPEEVLRGPAYSVHVDSGGDAVPELGDRRTETLFFNIKGVVVDEKDPAAAIAHAIRDVRYAIDQDFLAGGAGSLQTLAVNLFFDEAATTDNGYYSLNGRGWFEQRVRVIVKGTLATI
jgi:hypothetical protein